STSARRSTSCFELPVLRHTGTGINYLPHVRAITDRLRACLRENSVLLFLRQRFKICVRIDRHVLTVRLGSRDMSASTPRVPQETLIPPEPAASLHDAPGTRASLNHAHIPHTRSRSDLDAGSLTGDVINLSTNHQAQRTSSRAPRDRID